MMKCPLCERTKNCGAHYCAIPKRASQTFERAANWVFWMVIGGAAIGLVDYFVLKNLCAAFYCGGPVF